MTAKVENFLASFGIDSSDEIKHHGVKGMKWGVTRYDNDGDGRVDPGSGSSSSSGANGTIVFKGVGRTGGDNAGLTISGGGGGGGMDEEAVRDGLVDAYLEVMNDEELTDEEREKRLTKFFNDYAKKNGMKFVPPKTGRVPLNAFEQFFKDAKYNTERTVRKTVRETQKTVDKTVKDAQKTVGDAYNKSKKFVESFWDHNETKTKLNGGVREKVTERKQGKINKAVDDLVNNLFTTTQTSGNTSETKSLLTGKTLSKTENGKDVLKPKDKPGVRR